ncbi:MAG TPA: hypothetical protein EYQ50_17370 [Verrucomicrobiales bacterium]|nr:hypothetical protein [Verrucomicrobiales bacterium]
MVKLFSVFLAIFTCVSTIEAQVDSSPFPENRINDFYANQARHYLNSDQPLPKILPQFPGLDGGSWGHWGQNPESDNTDPRLNEVDFGGLLMQVTRFKGGIAVKGVNVKLGEFTALFDPLTMTFVSAWKGDFVIWAARRYGITSGVQAGGSPLMDFGESRWQLPEDIPKRYLGFFRNREHIVFKYKMGEAVIYDTLRIKEGQLAHSLSVDGSLPGGAFLKGSLRFEFDQGETKDLAVAGPARWKGQEVATKGISGRGSGPYVIDTLTVPYRDANPFKTPMRIGGVGVMPDGRIAVSTIMGDVWLIDGVNDDLEELTWKRFASGLHQPMGLVVRDGKIHVIGRDQLTCLHDLNHDGEADFYECVTNEFPTKPGNSFALTLHQDSLGRFYWFTRAEQFGMTRFTPGSRPESIATGLRGTNGTGVSPDGSLVFAMPQEGSWTPASGIFEVGNGSYHGHFGPKPEYGKYGYQMPMCFVPRGIDNSSGDIAFIPSDERFGPLAGRMLGTSYGYCQYYLVLRETVGEGIQGGIMPLPGNFLSGAHRMAFSPLDGHLYVAGTDGWQSYASENGSLQRVRYTGGQMPLTTEVETRENGLLIRFNTDIDPLSLNRKRAFCEQWNYLYSGAYGSQEYSVKYPGQQGHDPVEIQSLQLLENGRTVFVEISQLHPVMQLHLYLELETRSGQPFRPDLYYSIFRLGQPFTDIAYYRPVPKTAWNDFPVPGENPVDSRLTAQEALGKIVGDEETLAAIAKLQVNAVAGLQFEPKYLEVKAGARVALTVVNKDMSLQHNFVLVRPESLQVVGEGSMKLASSPRGLAQHYVIKDEGVLAMSPILEGGASYIVYFNAPSKPGEYPYLCTFPGHWQVTRGVLKVIP